MPCEYTCDDCGKREPAAFYATNPTRFFKPHDWFERGDKDGIQVACSRGCIEKTADKTGKTKVVIPC